MSRRECFIKTSEIETLSVNRAPWVVKANQTAKTKKKDIFVGSRDVSYSLFAVRCSLSAVDNSEYHTFIMFAESLFLDPMKMCLFVFVFAVRFYYGIKKTLFLITIFINP